MRYGIDDFTIVLPELTDMATCGLEMHDGLDRLWRTIERYKMLAPSAIRVVDNQARCIRPIRGTRHQTTGWQLADETPAGTPLPEGELEFPLNINLQDAMGNILKMRLHFAIDGASKGHLDRTSFRLHVFRFACLVSTAS